MTASRWPLDPGDIVPTGRDRGSLRLHRAPDGAAALAEAIYFGTGRRLFGWHHAPAGPRRGGGVVLCNPIGFEALYVHRAYRHLAEHLAAKGFRVLRFDYFGTGDSAGGDAEPDAVATWLWNIAEATEELGRRADGPVTLVGMRLGGTLAATAAARAPVDHLVLWAPLAAGRSFIRELKAVDDRVLPNSATHAGSAGGRGLEAGGFTYSPDVLASIAALDLATLERAPAPKVLLIDRDDLPGDQRVAAVLAGLGSAIEQSSPPGYAAMMHEPHHSTVPTEAIAAIGDWLAAHHPPDPRPASPRGTRPTVQRLHLAGAQRHVVERPVRFGDRSALFGIITEPANAPAARGTIVLLNAGALHRIGPSRLYVGLAREWAAEGFRVVRLDLSGIGDSAAHPAAEEASVCNPRQVDDVRAVLEELYDPAATALPTVLGFCSGARLAFASAAAGLPIARTAFINPIAFRWQEGDLSDNSEVAHFAHVAYYRQSLRHWERWRRLLRGETNFRAAGWTVAREAARAARQHWAIAREQLGFRAASHGRGDLGSDLETIAGRGVGIGIFFSRGEPGLELLQARAGRAVRQLCRRGALALRVIDGGDHTFSKAAARELLRQELRTWLGIASG